MKTKLLKLALCAFVATLPMGAWADIDFGTEATVSTTKTWVFDDLTGSPWSATTCVNSEYYLRAQNTNSRTVTLTDLGSSETLTFCDGATTTANKYLAIIKTNNSPVSGMTANSSNADGGKIYATGAFAFNADVAGTVYVKIKGNENDALRIYFSDGTNVATNTFTATSNIDEIAYTSTGKGTFFIGDAFSNFQIYAVRFVPTSVVKTTIGTTHEWTFDKKLLGVTSVVYAGDGLYLRGSGSTNSNTAIGGSTRTLSISTKGGGDPSSETLGEEDVTITNVVTTYNGIEAPNSNTKDAGSISSSKATPMLAVKTSVPGTLYAAVRPVADGSGTSRIYFTDGTADPANVSSGQITLSSASTTYKPYAHATSSGTFFIGAATVACKIYALRFVPESVTAPTIKNNNGTITITAGVSSVGATVKTYYTTDGSTPTSLSTEYTGTFSQTTAATIKAITISESSASTASAPAEKEIPAIPTVLSSKSISFAGLTSSNVTMDDADNFETTDPYKTNTSSATALYIKDVIFCYTQNNRTITLNPNYVTFSGAPMTITIPGLTAGDIVAISSSSNNSSAVTFACTSGGTLISGATNSIQTTPTNVYFQSTGGNMVLTITNAGLRLYDINVTDGVALTEANGLTPFEGIKNTTVKASFSRTFSSGKASTVVLPFDYTPSTEGTYYTFTGVDEENSTVYMTASAGSLTAGTPYLFMPSTTAVTFSNNAYTVPAEGFTAAGTADNGSWHFKGTYENLTWDDGQTVLYGLAASDFVPTSGSVTVGDFVRFNSGTTAAFRAYMYYGGVAPTHHAAPVLPESMKVVLIGMNGETTAIGRIPVVYDENSNWYTLDGRQLNSKPTEKGLYINNGRKVIIK